MARDKHHCELTPYTFGQLRRCMSLFVGLCGAEAFVSLGLPVVDYDKAAEYLSNARVMINGEWVGRRGQALPVWFDADIGQWINRHGSDKIVDWDKGEFVEPTLDMPSVAGVTGGMPWTLDLTGRAQSTVEVEWGGEETGLHHPKIMGTNYPKASVILPCEAAPCHTHAYPYCHHCMPPELLACMVLSNDVQSDAAKATVEVAHAVSQALAGIAVNYVAPTQSAVDTSEASPPSVKSAIKSKRTRKKNQ